MHKVLQDAIIKCRIRKVHTISPWEQTAMDAYCACCPLGAECANYELGEQDTLHHKKKEEKA